MEIVEAGFWNAQWARAKLPENINLRDIHILDRTTSVLRLFLPRKAGATFPGDERDRPTARRQSGLRVRWGWRACGVALAYLMAFGCSERSEPPNVVLVTIDSLRADHVGVYGYARETTPTLDRLGGEGVTFWNAVSSTSWTLPAHTTLLTGLPDGTHGVLTTEDRIPEQATTLAEFFQKEGYRTIGIYSGPFLSPGYGFDQGFDHYLDCTSYGITGRATETEHKTSHEDITNPAILEAVRKLFQAQEQAPFFLFLHLWDVHFDYIPPPPYDKMFNPHYDGTMTGRDFSRNESFKTGMSSEDFKQIVALYDGEIRATDDTLGQILTILEENHSLRNTVIVVTSDHGDEFLDHGSKGHRHTLYEELVRVPLILWYPRAVAPRRVNEVVRFMDVAPTILELAGVDGKEFMIGESMLQFLQDEGGGAKGGRPALSELVVPKVHLELSALRAGSRKLIVDHESKELAYFDLSSDPNEQLPIGEAGNAEVAAMLEMHDELRKLYRELGPKAGEVPVLDERTKRQIRALGYAQ